MRLQERVIIVTGGGRGIGAHYSLRLAREGAAVVVADIAEDDAQRVAGEISRQGGRAAGFAVDVSDPGQTQEMARFAADRFGGIDGLVNNAAMFANLERKPWDAFSPDEWDRILAVNVKGVWLASLAVVPYLKQRGKGKIVNIGSSSIYSATNRLIPYTASKGAVMAMTRVMARELGPFNICVNCLKPGQTMSGTNEEMTDEDHIQENLKKRCISRLETPEDLGGTVVFLLSDDADFLTGQTLVVDGGVAFVG